MGDLFFRVFFICVFCSLTALRLYFRIRSGMFREPPYSPLEPIGFILFRSILGIPLLLAVFLYCFLPGLHRWSYLALPVGLRVPGIVLAPCALLLLTWAHRTLDGNFSTGLAIIGMLMTLRRVREERLLSERFGDSYRKYKEKTGTFIPRLGR
jgi:protein-S-isoprenylcysteine O-methyltransferase Ste14